MIFPALSTNYPFGFAPVQVLAMLAGEKSEDPSDPAENDNAPAPVEDSHAEMKFRNVNQAGAAHQPPALGVVASPVATESADNWLPHAGAVARAVEVDCDAIQPSMPVVDVRARLSNLFGKPQQQQQPPKNVQHPVHPTTAAIPPSQAPLVTQAPPRKSTQFASAHKHLANLFGNAPTTPPTQSNAQANVPVTSTPSMPMSQNIVSQNTPTAMSHLPAPETPSVNMQAARAKLASIFQPPSPAATSSGPPAVPTPHATAPTPVGAAVDMSAAKNKLAALCGGMEPVDLQSVVFHSDVFHS